MYLLVVVFVLSFCFVFIFCFLNFRSLPFCSLSLQNNKQQPDMLPFFLLRLLYTELDEFNSTIATLVEVMDGQATKIERAKLKAIGQRNKVDSEEGNRKRRAEELRAQINEDLTDLERLRAEHDSLNAVELEQRSLIERLSNNA